MNEQFDMTAKKVKTILGCIIRMVTNKWQAVTVSFHFVLSRPCSNIMCNDPEELEQVHRRATNIISRLDSQPY